MAEPQPNVLNFASCAKEKQEKVQGFGHVVILLGLSLPEKSLQNDILWNH